MAKDQDETLEGGYLRDKFGRRELVLAEKHAAPGATALPQGDGYTDADGREQVVLLGADGRSISSRVQAVESESLDWVNVTKPPYNATGDGTTDDRAAIQAAITAVGALPRGGVVYLPAGNYLIGTPGLSLPSNSQVGITLQGDGMGSTPGGSQTTRLTRNGAYTLLTAAGTGTDTSVNCHGFQLRDLSIRGETYAEILVLASRCTAMHWENVRLAYSGHHALKGVQLFNAKFTNCLFEASGDPGSLLAAVLLTDAGVDVNVDNTNTVQFVNCHWEGNLWTDLRLDGTLTPSAGVIVTGSKFERSAGYAIHFRNATQCAIVGAYIYVNSANPGIFYEGATRNSMVGLQMLTPNPPLPSFLIDLATGSEASITGCTLRGGGVAHIRLATAFGAASIIGNTHVTGNTELDVTDVRTTRTGLIATRGGISSYTAPDNGQTGILAPSSRAWAYSTFGPMTANQARIVRFVPTRDMTIVKIAFAVLTAATNDDAVDVGIYDASMARLVSKGATTGLLNTTGVKEVTVSSTTLRRGTTYYAAISCGTVGGTGASLAGANFVNALAARLFGSTNGVLETDLMNTAHPLPSTFVPAGTGGTGFALAIRES